jgi:two-component system, OmpR family, phosphate regulon sensor histidine kinase PhoR
MQKQQHNAIILFYLMVGYIFASFMWWSYLLYDKNESLYEAQINAAYLNHNAAMGFTVSFENFQKTKTHDSIVEKHNRQKWMIFGEGSVFLVLLILGTIQLFRTFSKEVSLARQQNNFLLSITHELKSPIASIKLSLQTLSKRIQFEEKYERLINNSIEDTDRLQGLVENILFAARMENHSYSFERNDENVSDIIDHLVKKYIINVGTSRTIHATIEPNIDYKIDKEAFRSALMNLLENAYKYSHLNSLIQIHFYQKDNQLFFEVKDEGKGISSEEKTKIFEKFYRIGNETTRNAKGTGLGLFIVKKVIESHNGKVWVENNHPKGSIFKIALPIEDEKANHSAIKETIQQHTA